MKGVREQIEAVMRSAGVIRYHGVDTVKTQTVGQHTYGVLWLIVLLTKGEASRELLIAALGHDTPEYIVGDIPSPTKRLLGSGALAAREVEVMVEAGLLDPPLTPKERVLLDFADRLEGALWCLREWKRGNRHIEQTLNRYVEYCAEVRLDTASAFVAADVLSYIEEERA